ncbi:YHS domain-containing protein [Candidatus Nitrosotenuis aquarius]
MKIDPVCKMELPDGSKSVSTQFEDETYYFCCPSCKMMFEKNPHKFK